MMKKRKAIGLIVIVIIAGLFLGAVFLTKKPFDVSYAYPRFDGYWYCMNTPTPELTNKEWQYTGPSSYKSNAGDIPISIRNKFGQDYEVYIAKVRVIPPNNENSFASGILYRDKTLYFHYPADFNTQQELLPGVYTYEWDINGKFVLCSGFVVDPPPMTKSVYRYEISHHGGIRYLPSFLGVPDCDTARIAGQVHNNIFLFDDATEGLKIQLSGNGVNMTSITGSNKDYGRGGYEFVLPDQISGKTYYIQVFNSENQALSSKTPVHIFTSCDKNLAWVNFEQVIFGK